MMETVSHVTSGLGLRKFQADGFLLTRVYLSYQTLHMQECNHPFWLEEGPYKALTSNVEFSAEFAWNIDIWKLVNK